MRSPLRQILFITLLALPLAAAAQPGKQKTVAKPKKPTPVVLATPQPPPDAQVETPAKKNGRPDDGKKIGSVNTFTPVYFYEYDRPGFTYSHILIEHDETGKGQISFRRDGYDDLWTDPLQLTEVTMGGLKGAFADLNFIGSTESYQFPGRDFSNMGNVTITLKKDGRSRQAKYNWTENKDAKFLMDEYRRISNEATWKFEILIARENQPLQTPGLMDVIDTYVNRKEISDPPHLVPFLTQLSTDERLPLIARNRAERLIKQIEKIKK
ncbi:MAG: hypothetical protein ACKVQJ_11405 [Pyrinomonadaceae bacterium]